MIKESLFRSDILSNIYHNFIFFLSYNDMYTYAGISFFILLFVWGTTFFSSPNCYRCFVPQENFKFKKSILSNKLAIVGLFLSVVLYICNMFAMEQSVFSTFDSMTIDFIDSMKHGIKSVFGEWRFTPLSGIDYNLIHGISNNYLIINIYILIKQLLCIYLIYQFLSFIPVTKRLVAITLINVVPAIFVVNNIIYIEQSIIIFVLLSLMSAEKYQKNNNKIFLLSFLIFKNLAIYAKETVILFYAGLGIYLLLEDVFDNKITINSFFTPLKLFKTIPMEWIMFWSMFIWFTLWFLSSPIEENRYLTTHLYSLLDVISAHKVELLLNLTAIIVALYNIIIGKCRKIFLFCEGTLIGSTIITVFIVFYLKSGSYSDYMLSYYLYLPAIFSTIYIFYALNQKMILSIIVGIVLCISAWQNYMIIDNQQGKSRRDIAEYIISNAKYKDMSVYLYSTDIIDYKWWKTMAWSSALKYANPNLRLKFKTNLDIYKYYLREEDKFYEKQLGYPTLGDHILVNKKSEKDYHPDANQKLVYENKFYQMYYVE